MNRNLIYKLASKDIYFRKALILKLGGRPKKERKPGEVWKTTTGFRAMNEKGVAKTFKEQEKAKQFAEGGKAKKEEKNNSKGKGDLFLSKVRDKESARDRAYDKIIYSEINSKSSKKDLEFIGKRLAFLQYSVDEMATYLEKEEVTGENAKEMEKMKEKWEKRISEEEEELKEKLGNRWGTVERAFQKSLENG